MKPDWFLLSVYVLSLLGWVLLRQFERFREGVLGIFANAGFIVGSGVAVVLCFIEPKNAPDV